MENLNDVEFGSDKNQEEAPILVAQRYLNIFRQIHIFSKEKRDQFDDELLALPQNILDFYKRMPGGRLLMEHIEDVKTERGISFVKTNKDDFSYDTSSSSSGDATSGGVPAPVVGGNVVMDASFAETLAQSMAAAFKGVPAVAAPVATGATSNVAVSADFGNAFDIIAEEIRTSRASLLDVLKETRNITDTVIASQVSISRVLEGLLASKNRDETDIANLNNKIIASQASITKLLEGLYSSSTSKNEEISNYLNIDNKLQDFRNDLTQTIMGSLSGFADRASATSDSGENLFFDIESRLATFKNEVKADVNKSLSEIKNLLAGLVQENGVHAPKDNSGESQNSLSNGNENWSPIAQIDSDDFSPKVSDAEDRESVDIHQKVNSFENDILESDNSSENIERKKKKKKKKKKNLDAVALSSVTDDAIASTVVPANHSAIDEGDSSFLDDSLDDIKGISDNDPTSKINVDDISAVNTKNDDVTKMADAQDELSEILSDLDNLDLSDEPVDEAEIKDDEIDKISPLDDLPSPSTASATDTTFQEPEIDNKQSFSEPAPLDDFDSISDITLSDEGTTEEVKDDELALNNLDDLLNSDSPIEDSSPKGESLSAEQQSDQVNALEDEPIHSDLDNLLDDEQLVDSTPEISDLNHQSFSALDDLTNDDDLDFALPKNNASETSSGNVQKAGLDTFVSDDGLDFALPKELDNDTSVVSHEDDLSSIQDTSTDVEEVQGDDSVTEKENLASESEDNQTHHPSRYSAELDKIREALTSDNIDLASLDQPIALDDYSDDENVAEEDDYTPPASTNSIATNNTPVDEDWEYEYVEDNGKEDVTTDSDQQNSQDNGDWEWEYVDENGNPAQVEGSNSDEDWEWEYVEDDETQTNDNPTEDNNNKE